jgi:diguanylate cyclase (GGDEF)-like protein
MTIHPAFLRLSAIVPIAVVLLSAVLFAFEFDILSYGGPTKSVRQKLELEEMGLLAALFSSAMGALALFNRRLMIRESRQRRVAEMEATTDALTGIVNRRHFLRIVEARVAAGVRRNQPCAVLLIDLDRFKPVNDTYGHAAGDAVLCAVARRIEQVLPVGHVVGRLGGDEFAIILGPAEDLKLELCAEFIRERIGRPISYGGREIRVGASIGIALSPQDGVTASALVAAADVRMYQRKRGGRRLEIVAAA